MPFNILSHPFVNVELTKLRNKDTPSKEFREGIHNLSFALAYESTRNIETKAVRGNTPISSYTGVAFAPRVAVTPILRAGLGMTDAMLLLFPTANVYHLGLFREKVSLQPVEYYSKLPPQPTVDLVFILDPMIATGGTACAALAMILDWGIPIKQIKLLSVLVSQEGLQRVLSEYPELDIWVAGIDDTLTSDDLIKPGLGDAGDRLFNTIRP